MSVRNSDSEMHLRWFILYLPGCWCHAMTSNHNLCKRQGFSKEFYNSHNLKTSLIVNHFSIQQTQRKSQDLQPRFYNSHNVKDGDRNYTDVLEGWNPPTDALDVLEGWIPPLFTVIEKIAISPRWNMCLDVRWHVSNDTCYLDYGFKDVRFYGCSV